MNKLSTSIIIRTKNENQWLDWLLDIITDQKNVNYEIIIVNNGNLSKLKKTLKNFSDLDLRIVNIKKYKPGYALNKGIEKSKFNLVTIISSHCIPTDNFWLFNLIYPIAKNKDCFASYGRQEPLSFTLPSDKRDMSIVFGVESKKQFKDPFFHNANSAINKKYWKKIPFDSTVTNIEDRIWASKIQKKYNKYIFYQPKASVYHWHGIHHSNIKERSESTDKVLSNLQFQNISNDKNEKPVFFIPYSSRFSSDKLLLDTVNSILEYNSTSNIFISTTSNLEKIALKLLHKLNLQNLHLFVRNKIYDKAKEPLDFVYKDLSRFVIKKSFSHNTPVICLEIQHGSRPKDFFKKIISTYRSNNCTSIFSSLKLDCTVVNEQSIKNSEKFILHKINENMLPKDLHKNNHNFIILKSYGFISSLDLLNIFDASGIKPILFNVSKYKKYVF